jgi:hypothetical protein
MFDTINKSIKYDPEVFEYLIETWEALNMTEATYDFHYLPTTIYYELHDILKNNRDYDTICFSYMANNNAVSTLFTKFKILVIQTIEGNQSTLKQIVQMIYGTILFVFILNNYTVFLSINLFISAMVASIVLYGFITLWTNFFFNWLSTYLQGNTFVKHPRVLYISYLLVNCKPSNSILIKFKNDQSFFGRKHNNYYECIVDEHNRIIETSSKKQLINALNTIVNATFVQYVS